MSWSLPRVSGTRRSPCESGDAALEPETLSFRRTTATRAVSVYWHRRERQLVVSWQSRQPLRRAPFGSCDGVWRFRPTPAQWETFWTVLDRLGVGDWRTCYGSARADVAPDTEDTSSAPAGNDGWCLTIVRGDRQLQTRGDGSYPFGFFTFQRALNHLVWGAVLGFWPADSASALLAASERDRRALEQLSPAGWFRSMFQTGERGVLAPCAGA